MIAAAGRVHDPVRRRRDPVNTPRGLNTANPNVGEALADAVADLDGAGIPLDAPLRGYQFERRGARGDPDPRRARHARRLQRDQRRLGPRRRRLPRRLARLELRDGDRVPAGTGGCQVADRSILTYSLCENPDSPYYADQTHMFSDKQWVDVPYCESEIESDPDLQLTPLNGGYAPPPDSTRAADPAPGRRRRARATARSPARRAATTSSGRPATT